MTILSGPANQAVPDVYHASPNPSSYDDSLCNFIGPFSAHSGDVWTTSFSSAVRSAGGPGLDIYLKEVSQLGVNSWAGQFASPLWAAIAGGASYNLTIPHDGTYYVGLLDGGNGINAAGGTGTLFAFEVQTTGPAPGAYCSGGTERKDLSTDLVIIGGSAVDAIAIFLGGLWLELLALLVDAIGVHVLSTATLCASLPPPMPTITNADYLALTGVTGAPTTDQIAKFWQAVQSAVWPYFCQCVPGTGVVSPPAPVAPGVTIVLPPPVTCDDGDVCSMLDSLTRKLDMVSLDIQYARRDITLIQRQSVPFASILGTLHDGLHGDGQFAVQGILGLSVSYIGGGSTIGSEPGNPNTVFDVGWLNVGDGLGFRSRERIRTNPWVWYPPDAGEITTVGYTLNPLVTASIQEILREP